MDRKRNHSFHRGLGSAPGLRCIAASSRQSIGDSIEAVIGKRHQVLERRGMYKFKSSLFGLLGVLTLVAIVTVAMPHRGAGSTGGNRTQSTQRNVFVQEPLRSQRSLRSPVSWASRLSWPVAPAAIERRARREMFLYKKTLRFSAVSAFPRRGRRDYRGR